MGGTTHFLDTTGRKYAESPLPAWAAAGTLISLFRSSRSLPDPVPRPFPLALFATGFLISGFMTYDGAKTDGAGTTAAWSIIYLVTKDARQAISPKRLFSKSQNLGLLPRIGPAVLTGLVGVNAVTHSWRFFRGDQKNDGVSKYRGGEGWAGDI